MGFSNSLVVLLRRVIGPGLGLLLISSGLSINIPSVVNHELEVLVVIDGGRDVRVVFDELVKSDLTVWLAVVQNVVMSLKSLEELEHNLLRGLLSGENIRVLGRVVSVLDIVDIYDSIAVLVQNLVGLLDKSTSWPLDRSSDDSQELVVGDRSVSVHVEGVENNL